MPPTNQDLVKGVDLTGITNIGATQVNQIIDEATPASDKGLTVLTVDSSLGVPTVPDASTTTKWQRYVWIRVQHSSFDRSSDPGVYVYVWDSDATPDLTYLNWIRSDATAVNLAADVATALADSATALSNSISAQNNATNALNEALSNTSRIEALEASLAALTARVTSLESSGNVIQTGQVIFLATENTYSNTTDEGFLKCDGSLVDKTVFANLFAKIGSTYGESGSDFRVPDVRGRVLVCSGTGTGLTARTIGQVVGAEQHTLTGDEAGGLNITVTQDGDAATGTRKSIENIAFNSLSVGRNGGVDTPLSGTAKPNGQTPHNNMQPSIVLAAYIKT